MAIQIDTDIMSAAKSLQEQAVALQQLVELNKDDSRLPELIREFKQAISQFDNSYKSRLTDDFFRSPDFFYESKNITRLLNHISSTILSDTSINQAELRNTIAEYKRDTSKSQQDSSQPSAREKAQKQFNLDIARIAKVNQENIRLQALKSLENELVDLTKSKFVTHDSPKTDQFVRDVVKKSVENYAHDEAQSIDSYTDKIFKNLKNTKDSTVFNLPDEAEFQATYEHLKKREDVIKVVEYTAVRNDDRGRKSSYLHQDLEKILQSEDDLTPTPRQLIISQLTSQDSKQKLDTKQASVLLNKLEQNLFAEIVTDNQTSATADKSVTILLTNSTLKDVPKDVEVALVQYAEWYSDWTGSHAATHFIGAELTTQAKEQGITKFSPYQLGAYLEANGYNLEDFHQLALDTEFYPNFPVSPSPPAWVQHAWDNEGQLSYIMQIFKSAPLPSSPPEAVEAPLSGFQNTYQTGVGWNNNQGDAANRLGNFFNGSFSSPSLGQSSFLSGGPGGVTNFANKLFGAKNAAGTTEGAVTAARGTMALLRGGVTTAGRAAATGFMATYGWIFIGILGIGIMILLYVAVTQSPRTTAYLTPIGGQGGSDGNGTTCSPGDPDCAIAACDPQKPDDCLWPTACGCVTQGPRNGAGNSHATANAIDIGVESCPGVSTKKHADVRATHDGVVVGVEHKYREGETVRLDYKGEGVDEETKKANIRGNYIQIQGTDANGTTFTTYYGHLWIIAQAEGKNRILEVGDSVKKGDPLGKTDNNGMSTGEHLHYQYDGGGKIEDAMLPQSPTKVTQCAYGSCPKICWTQ
jgi:hypothetical protein